MFLSCQGGRGNLDIAGDETAGFEYENARI
jgi:hypothetical protein